MSGRQARDPRRLGLGAAAIIAGYAVVVGAISARASGDEFSPPEVVPRPIFLAAMLMLPAIVAAIGAIRRSRPLVIAAGALCLAQSFVAFSGVTLPFIVPAFLLLALGATRGWAGASRRTKVSGVFVFGLGIAMWVAPFALTQTTCWVARAGPAGTVIYAPIPVPGDAGSGSGSGAVQLGLDPTELASGCDGGSMTVQGLALAAVFGIGAVALAALPSTPRS